MSSRRGVLFNFSLPASGGIMSPETRLLLWQLCLHGQGGTRTAGGIHVVASGSAARGTSAEVLPTNPGQGVRGEMMGCSLEGGEDAERKPPHLVGGLSLGSSNVAGWWLWEDVLAPAAWMLNSFFYITRTWTAAWLGWILLDEGLSRFW